MFEILLRLSVESLTGLRALRERRRLGLTDAVRLSVVYMPGGIAVPVDEGWAEAYFDADSISEIEAAVLADCSAGDVVPDGESTVLVCLRPGLHPDRVRDLWLAARQRRQREEGQ